MSSPDQQVVTASLEAEVAALATLDPVALSDQDVRDGVLGLLRVLNQIAGVAAGFIGSFDARSLSEVDAMRATRTWLEGFGRMSQGAATGWLKRSRLLREMPALAEASKEGSVSTEHVGKVCGLETKVGVAAIKQWDVVLATLASDEKPAKVAEACVRLRAYLDPDGPQPDPDAAFQRRGLTIARFGSMFDIRGQLDPEGAAALKTALDALMKPPAPDDLRTAAQRRADALIELTRIALVAGELPTVGGARPQLGILVSPQTLLGTDRPTRDQGSNSNDGQAPTSATAHGPTAKPPPCADDDTDHDNGAHDHADGAHDGDAHCHERSRGDHVDDDLDEDNRSDGNHGDDRDAGRGGGSRSGYGLRSPRAEPGDLLTQFGVPRLPEPPWMSWIGDIPPELAQRISCDCDVWRAVLDPATGLPLEVGRTHRLVPHWIRSALHARDRGCRWPGCDAPTQWTDAHHLIAWYYGGETNIDNLLLVCRYHHARVHEGRWTIYLDPTTGQVSVTRPDGRPYELGPSRPWTSAHTRGGEPPGYANFATAA